MAAIWPDKVKRLALIAPFGLFDEKDPATDPWAQKADEIPGLMSADPDTYKKLKEMPAGANSIEWPIEQTRAAEAAARIFWPLGNTKLERRLPLIKAPTLLLWGEKDRLMPRSYAATIAKAIKAKTETEDHRRRGPSRRARQARRGRRRRPRVHALSGCLLVTSAMTMACVASAFGAGACARAGVQRTCVNVHPARTALQSVRRLPVILRLRARRRSSAHAWCAIFAVPRQSRISERTPIVRREDA